MTYNDHLYLIESSTKHVKIGRSIAPMARMRDLQGSTPGDLSLVSVVLGAGSREYEVHAMFDEYRTHGEWFHDRTEIRDFFQAQRGNSRLARQWTSEEKRRTSTWSYFTAREVAQAYGVAFSDLEDLVASGEVIPARAFAGRRRYKLSSAKISTLVSSQKAQANK